MQNHLRYWMKAGVAAVGASISVTSAAVLLHVAAAVAWPSIPKLVNIYLGLALYVWFPLGCVAFLFWRLRPDGDGGLRTGLITGTSLASVWLAAWFFLAIPA